MRVPVWIISGFLGAGKTTYIEKILREKQNEARYAIIENDFGEVSFDSQRLQGQAVQVKELRQGCICCSLVGDFKEALLEALREAKDVDAILIEPSGVGKLSDILEALSTPVLMDKVEVKGAITLVDAEKIELYAKNFGEFYCDQIQHADLIVLTHTLGMAEDVAEYKMRKVFEELGITKLMVRMSDIQGGYLYKKPLQEEVHHHCDSSCCHCHHEEELAIDAHIHTHEHHACSCHHGRAHDAHEVFETYTWQEIEARTQEVWTSWLEQLVSSPHILRGKGIITVQEEEGICYREVQILQGRYTLLETEQVGAYMTIITEGVGEYALP